MRWRYSRLSLAGGSPSTSNRVIMPRHTIGPVRYARSGPWVRSRSNTARVAQKRSSAASPTQRKLHSSTDTKTSREKRASAPMWTIRRSGRWLDRVARLYPVSIDSTTSAMMKMVTPTIRRLPKDVAWRPHASYPRVTAQRPAVGPQIQFPASTSRRNLSRDMHHPNRATRVEQCNRTEDMLNYIELAASVQEVAANRKKLPATSWRIWAQEPNPPPRPMP
jgi:hypothetical protein